MARMFSLESLRGATPPIRARLSTGMPALDAVLGGGLSLGQLAEISGAAGTGRSSLALSLALRCLALGHAVAWIESQPRFWPLQPLEAGLPLDRLLLVRVAAEERLRALQLLLASPGAAAVAVVDLEGARAGREIAPHQLVQLHRLAERSATLVLFLTDRGPEATSLGPLIDVRLHLRPARALPPGPAEPGAGEPGERDIFERQLELEILRHKQGPSRGRFTEPLHGPDRLRLRSTL